MEGNRHRWNPGGGVKGSRYAMGSDAEDLRTGENAGRVEINCDHTHIPGEWATFRSVITTEGLS